MIQVDICPKYRLQFPSSDGAEWIESFITKDTNGRTIEEILRLLNTRLCDIRGSDCSSKNYPAVRDWAWRLVEA